MLNGGQCITLSSPLRVVHISGTVPPPPVSARGNKRDMVPEAFTMLNGGGNESHCRRHCGWCVFRAPCRSPQKTPKTPMPDFTRGLRFPLRVAHPSRKKMFFTPVSKCTYKVLFDGRFFLPLLTGLLFPYHFPRSRACFGTREVVSYFFPPRLPVSTFETAWWILAAL